MNAIYQVANLSKQAHLAYEKRRQKQADNWVLLEPILTEWRDRHPSMSLKKLYVQIQPDFIGRNLFIDYGMANGFELIPYKKSTKTTIPVCTRYYPNLLTDLIICDINQVWVSDITYFKIFDKWYYIVLIMDLYSRKIIGHFVAKNMFAQANLNALNLALKNRGITRFNQSLIHHSDRGSQYNSLLYTNALMKAEIQISMGKIVYDNIHIERVNQTIKGEYLRHRNINSFNDLKSHSDRDVDLYNEERPHLALGMKTPTDFERYICNIPLCQRTPMRVFALKKKSNPNLVSSPDPNQLCLPFS